MKLIYLNTIFLAVALGLSGCNSSSSSGGSSPTNPDTGNPSTPGNGGDQDLDETPITWNLDQWKITLPISQTYYRDTYNSSLSGGTSAAELVPGGCEGKKDDFSEDTYLPEYVYYGNYGHLHFRVDLDGDGLATTANTSYVRSELRELYNYQTTSGCSTSNQNWRIQDNDYHQLQGTLVVNQHPNVSQPKVIVGQIHGQKIKQALVKLQWEGDSRPIRVILNDSFAENNESCTSCSPFSVELGFAKAGDQWSYNIVANDEGLRLEAAGVSRFIEWGETVQWDGKFYTLSEDWANNSNSFYFKAGIYPQLKASDYSGVFDVSFSEIKITHQ